MPSKPELHNRGAASNPPNRFMSGWVDISWRDTMMDADDHWTDEDPSPGPTEVIKEHAKSVISHNDSPDVGMDYSVNVYRGCEHGCIYCFARPYHEYLGFSSGLDFETKIIAKENAPQILRKELAAKSWKPRTVMMSAVTDCYQPIERKLEITRRCVEVFADFRNPLCIVTKNFLVTRDIDHLQKLAQYGAVSVCLSVTSLNPEVARRMEPRASTPQRRIAAVRQLNEAGIPAGILICPVIPGLTDHEMPDILQAAAEAGAKFAGYNIVKLPYANRELFEQWLAENFPMRHDKVLSKIKQMRDGKLYDPDFGKRATGSGPLAEQIGTLFRIAKRKAGIPERGPGLSTSAFRRPTPGQASLFD